MRAYLVTTAIVFALVVALHIARLIGEWSSITSDGGALATTVATALLAAALSIWAIRLLREMPRQM